MKYVFVSLIILITQINAYAKDNKLSQEEFLSLLDSDRIVMERAPVVALPDAVQAKVFESQKRMYPNFSEKMWFVNFYQTSKYIYTVFWEWPTHRCLYRAEELDPKLGKPNEKTLDPTGVVIHKKYCEKQYGLNL